MSFCNENSGLNFCKQAQEIPLTGSFSDRTEVLCSPSESDVFCPEDSSMVAQDAHGPSHIVIGALVSDEQLMKLASRVSTGFAALIAFRDTKKISPDRHSKSGA